LLGREADLEAAQALLLQGDVRLVTVTGPPGVGKTRFAVAIASAVEEEFDDGAVFVDLTPVSDPRLVVNALAQVLGVIEDPGRVLLRTLTEYLDGRSLLIILDNFEQVAAAGPDAVSLLTAGPNIKLLITSREPLHVSWERTYALPPLAHPETGARHDAAALARFPATALFIERARAAQAGFSADDASGPAIAEICRRLDGLPLAIELAAAWTKVLGLQEILAKLHRGQGLPDGGRHDVPERHRTLTSAIASSYELLSQADRAIFRRLGAFAGGASLEAIEFVCQGASPDVLVSLSSLVNKNLVLRLDAGETRFRLLETIREFALQELDRAGETDGVRSRHIGWFLRLAERAWRLLWSEHQATWLERMDREHDNVRSALHWALLEGKDEEAGVCLAGAMNRFWYVRGHFREAQQWLAVAASKRRISGRARARALAALANHLYARGSADAALATAEEAVALAEAVDEPILTAMALQAVALAAMARDDPRTEGLIREMLAASRRAGDAWLTARALAYLGGVLQNNGDLVGAKRALEEALLLARPLGDRWLMSTVTSNYGWALASEDPARAEAFFKESLTLAHETGHRWRIVHCLENLAGLLIASRRAQEGAMLLGAAETLREVIGSPRGAPGRLRFERTVAAAREQLGPARFEALWRKGRNMTLDDTVALGLGRSVASSRPRSQRPGGLTGREVQITLAMARGLTNREIAEELAISERTVDAHVQNILNKLGMSRRTQVVSWASAHLPASTPI
jgi:non-specific serine/threonine protein kinase